MNKKLSTVFIILCFLFVTSSVAFAKKGDDDKDKDRDRGKKGLRHIVKTLQQQIADLQSQIDNIQLTPGPAGPKGDTGPQGPAGADGTNGTNGVDGAQGPKGDTGPQGIAGLDGTNGIDGAAGPKGDTGSKGDTGPQGPPGNDGQDGADSLVAGPPGPKGDTGPRGLDGFQGPKGDTGDAGPQGPAGTPKVHYVTGHGLDESKDNGQLTTRSLTFTKESNTSDLMVTYSDNFRAHHPSIGFAQGMWQVYLDGNPTDLRAPLHTNRNLNSNVPSNNIHRQGTLVGFLRGVAAGSHNISISVHPIGTPSDLHTGWADSTFSLVVQELD